MDRTVHSTGLSVVYEPTTPKSHAVEYDKTHMPVGCIGNLLTHLRNSIVFVHGILGHPKHTWTRIVSSEDSGTASSRNKSIDLGDSDIDPRLTKRPRANIQKTKEVFWPRDLLPRALPQARILTWGYDVTISNTLFSKSNAKDSVFQHAEVLLSDLFLKRHEYSDRLKPLIFIAHSLGGIIVKDALCRSRIESTWTNEILPATLGVMFLGTPHHGSNAATLGSIVVNLLKSIFRYANTKVLSALEKDSETLHRVTHGFGQIMDSRNIQIHSFQEEKRTHGMMIVEKQASSIGYLRETKANICADHVNMAKFRSFTDRDFEKVTAVLKEWLQSVQTPRKQPNFSESAGIKPGDLPDGLVFDELYDDCLQSLNVAEARTRIENVKPAYKDTYDWLFSDRVGFAHWLAGKDTKSIHWISGKPGSGKSTMMKFAMGHACTRRLLCEHDPNPWQIAGYFFHDRGSEVQKSIEGFLREILYQVLKEQRECFTAIYTLYVELTANVGAKKNARANASLWTQSRLREALQDVVSKTSRPLNLCLFVDALDEHHGDHSELITILLDLTRDLSNANLRLRLCLAGRPENNFKDAFNNYIGFAIHKYTENDIRHYAEDRIRREIQTQLTMSGKKDLDAIVKDIIHKARGVFLWVRLVVNELVEGLTNGMTFDQLQKLLSEIPEELEDLYVRAVCRQRRGSKAVLADEDFETFIVFQMVMCARKPLLLEDCLMAAYIFRTGQSAYDEFSQRSDDHMKRKFNKISRGLLEEVAGGHVQYIHQTVKEFMKEGRGSDLIKKNVDTQRFDSGHLLIFQYVWYQIGYGSTPRWSTCEEKLTSDARERRERMVHGTFKRCVRDSSESAEALEYEGRIPASEHIQSKPSEKSSDDIIKQVIGYHFKAVQLEVLQEVEDRDQVRLLIFCILCNLPLSVERILRSSPECLADGGVAFLLVYAAFLKNSKTRDVLTKELMNPAPSREVIQVLMDANVGKHIEEEGIDYLHEMITRQASKPKPSYRHHNIPIKLWYKLVGRSAHNQVHQNRQPHRYPIAKQFKILAKGHAEEDPAPVSGDHSSSVELESSTQAIRNVDSYNLRRPLKQQPSATPPERGRGRPKGTTKRKASK